MKKKACFLTEGPFYIMYTYAKVCTRVDIRLVKNVNKYLVGKNIGKLRAGYKWTTDAILLPYCAHTLPAGTAIHTRPAPQREYDSGSMGSTTKPYSCHTLSRLLPYRSHTLDRYGKSMARSIVLVSEVFHPHTLYFCLGLVPYFQSHFGFIRSLNDHRRELRFTFDCADA